MADTVDQAGAEAEKVARAVELEGSLNPAYEALEGALAAYVSAGGVVDDVVPGGDAEGLGFGRRPGNGRSIWKRYVDVLHDELCTPDGQLNQTLTAGLTSTGAGLVTAIIATLGISAAAATVVAPIAGVMLALGVKAFCEPEVESGSAS